MRSHRRWTWGLAIWAIVLLCHAALLPSAVSANPGLRVDGAVVIVPVEPGVAYDHTLHISSETGDPAMDIEIEANGFGRALDGAFISLSPADIDSPYSAREYFGDIDRSSFVLQPGAEEQVNLTFNVPDNVGAGGRYAIIEIQARRLDEGDLGTVSVVQVPVLLTVSRTELIHNGRITSLVVDNVTAGQPMKVYTTVANTGNHHYKAINQVILTNADGEEVARAASPMTETQVIPLSANLFEVSIPLSEIPNGLPEGAYQIESRVFREDGPLIDSETVSFQAPPRPEQQRSTWFWYLIAGLVALLLLILAGAAGRRKRKRAEARR